MTQKALEKIGIHRKILESLAVECRRHRDIADGWHKVECERLAGKIRGYLEALENCDVITHREMQSLYLYFKL